MLINPWIRTDSAGFVWVFGLSDFIRTLLVPARMHAGMEHFLSGKQWHCMWVDRGRKGSVQCRDQESSVSRLQSPHLAVAIACTLGLGSAVRALHGSTAAGEERRSCRCYAGSLRPCAGPAFLFGFAAGARRPGRPWARGKTFAAAAAGCAASLPFPCSNAQVNPGTVLLSVAQQIVGRPNYIYICCCTAAATD
jgi:hypothetical protein